MKLFFNPCASRPAAALSLSRHLVRRHARYAKTKDAAVIEQQITATTTRGELTTLSGGGGRRRHNNDRCVTGGRRLELENRAWSRGRCLLMHVAIEAVSNSGLHCINSSKFYLRRRTRFDFLKNIKLQRI